MAAEENWWAKDRAVAKPNQAQQVDGGVYVPPAPEKPEKPREAPSGYRYNAQGNVEFIPGGPADPGVKGLTESESKAVGFYQRMRSSETQMKRLGMGPQDWSTLIQQRVSPTFSRASLTDKQRTQLDLMENWIAASMRLESGAAIAPDEFEKQARIFFPQPGAGKEEKASKDQQRELSILGFRTVAGPGAQEADTNLRNLGFIDEEGKPIIPTGMTAGAEAGEAGAAPAPQIKVAEGAQFATDEDFRKRAENAEAWAATEGLPFDQALIQFNKTLAAKGYGEAGPETIDVLRFYEDKKAKRNEVQWQLPTTGVRESGAPGPLSAIGSGILTGASAGLGEELVQQFSPETASKFEAAKQFGRQEYPGITLGSEILGGITSPLNLVGPGGTIAREAVRGALYGGAMGSGEAAPDAGFSERIIPGIVGGVTGGVAGGVGQKYITPAVTSAVERYVAPTVSRMITPSAAQAIPAAEAAGIPLLTTDIVKPTTWWGNWTQQTLEKIPVIGTGGQRAAQREAREAAITKLYDDFQGGTTEIDDVTKDFLKVRGEQIGKNVRKKEEVFAKVAGKPVVVDDTLKVLDDAINQYGPLQSYSALTGKLQQFRTDLLSNDIGKIELTRKAIGDAFNDDSLKPVSTELQKVVNDLYPALNKDIGRHIQRFGEAGDFAKWKSANEDLADFATDLSTSTVRRVLRNGNASPSEARLLLFSKNKSDVEKLYSGLSEEGKKNARAVLVQEFVEKAGGIDEISPAKFLTQLKNAKKTIGVAFEPEEAQRLTGLMRALQFTRRADQAAVSLPTGQALIPFAAGGLGAYFSPVAGAASATIGAIVAGARAYESKAAKNLLITLSRTAPGSKAEQNVLASLSRITARQAGQEGGETAQEVQESMAPPEVPIQ